MEKTDFKLELSVEEVNQLLQLLSTRPYSEVVNLINKLTTQANEQLPKEE